MAMALRSLFVVLCMTSLLEGSATDTGTIVDGVKWRACDGFATNVAYITGEDTDYVASWAMNPSRNALLNKGSDKQAACDALLVAGQVGEIYVISQDPDCTDGCLRMAIYPEAEVGMNIGTVAGDSENFVCAYSATPPEQPECPTNLVAGVKWRACDGFATNAAYITGEDTNYVASWAMNPSKNALLNKGASWSDMEEACEALLAAGQVGEIYVIANDPNCTDGCLRMAIYPETEAGMMLGTVAGDSENWVCGYSAPPPEQPACPMTCGEVKEAYRSSECCGMPNAMFDADASRRLSASSQTPSTATILSHMEEALESAKAESHVKANSLKKQMNSILQKYNEASSDL